MASLGPQQLHTDPIADAKAQEATHNYVFRLATLEDVPALQRLIAESMRELGREYYSQTELDGSIGWLFGPDTVLMRDRTYYILHPASCPSTLAASGGWSFRHTLFGADSAPNRLPARRDPLCGDRASIRAIFTHPKFARRGLGTMMMRFCEDRAREAGFGGGEMGATLGGVGLYERCGWRRVRRGDGIEEEEVVVRCPNGEGVRIVRMVKEFGSGGVL